MVGKVDGAAIGPDVGNGGSSYGGGGNPSRDVSEPWFPREFE